MCRLAHCVVIEDHKDNNEATSDVNEAAPCPPSVDDASVSVEALAGLSIKDVDHDSNEMFCGICLEPLGQMRNDQGEIKHIRKKFGLLSSCDHMFCIHCLRTWRHQQKKNASNNASSDRTSIRVRACPACRQASDFVVPSDRFCTGEEKRQVVSSYQARLSCTPCKRFNGKLGSCPFGRDCFYAHWNRETGHDMKSQDKTKLELWKDKQDRKRLKEQRRRLQQRSSTAGLLAGISSQEIGVMHDLLYLSSIDRLLSTVEERNQGDHVGDDNDNDLLAFDPRLMQVLRGHRHGRSLEMLRRLYSSDRPTGNT
jgi:E3 ubiquitin-protein ligase makorin